VVWPAAGGRRRFRSSGNARQAACNVTISFAPTSLGYVGRQERARRYLSVCSCTRSRRNLSDEEEDECRAQETEPIVLRAGPPDQRVSRLALCC